MPTPKITPKRKPATWHRVGTVYVAGLMHADYDSTKIKRGQRVRLYHERSNPVDHRAISVYVEAADKTRKVGYVLSCALIRKYNAIDYLHGLKARGFSFYCLVNQHDMGNDTNTRMTIQIKVKHPRGLHPFDGFGPRIEDGDELL